MAEYKGTAHYRKAHKEWLAARKLVRAEYERRRQESLKHDAATKEKYRVAGLKYK